MQRSMWRPKRLLLGVALPFFCLAFAESVWADSKVYQDMLHSTGLVEVPHTDGRITYGACWLVDDERRLAITAQHLVKGAAEVVVYFPVYRDGAAIPELVHYHRSAAAIHGQVVHRDTQRDLAVLRLDSLPEHVNALLLDLQSTRALQSSRTAFVLETVLEKGTLGPLPAELLEEGADGQTKEKT